MLLPILYILQPILVIIGIWCYSIMWHLHLYVPFCGSSYKVIVSCSTNIPDVGVSILGRCDGLLQRAFHISHSMGNRRYIVLSTCSTSILDASRCADAFRFSNPSCATVGRSLVLSYTLFQAITGGLPISQLSFL